MIIPFELSDNLSAVRRSRTEVGEKMNRIITGGQFATIRRVYLTDRPSVLNRRRPADEKFSFSRTKANAARKPMRFAGNPFN